MNIIDIFRILRDDIHTTVVATVDENGLPETRVIDIMLYDESGIYFITARGKRFYKSLIDKKYVSLSGVKGDDTMSSIAISVSGKVKEEDNGFLEKVFDENSYMEEIYPTKESQNALTVFKLYCGNAEYFDLSKKPIERYSFSFGQCKSEIHGYFINAKCIGCGKCAEVCPQNCIDITENTASIRNSNCLHCGNCSETCPVGAVERK